MDFITINEIINNLTQFERQTFCVRMINHKKPDMLHSWADPTIGSYRTLEQACIYYYKLLNALQNLKSLIYK